MWCSPMDLRKGIFLNGLSAREILVPHNHPAATDALRAPLSGIPIWEQPTGCDSYGVQVPCRQLPDSDGKYTRCVGR